MVGVLAVAVVTSTLVVGCQSFPRKGWDVHLPGGKGLRFSRVAAISPWDSPAWSLAGGAQADAGAWLHERSVGPVDAVRDNACGRNREALGVGEAALAATKGAFCGFLGVMPLTRAEAGADVIDGAGRGIGGVSGGVVPAHIGVAVLPSGAADPGVQEGRVNALGCEMREAYAPCRGANVLHEGGTPVAAAQDGGGVNIVAPGACGVATGDGEALSFTHLRCGARRHMGLTGVDTPCLAWRQ